MARKNVQEPAPPEPVEATEPEPDDREKPISPEPEPPSDDERAAAEEYATAGLTPEQREARRLSRKPPIDHLPDGTAVYQGQVIPLFDVGDRIVAERHIDFLAGNPWLDTRIYVVRSIDDDTGAVHCTDEEMQHYACVGFKRPLTRIKLAPKKGNPFNAPKVKREEAKVELPPGEKKKRGRPKGSKNRPKEEIRAEKQARKEARSK